LEGVGIMGLGTQEKAGRGSGAWREQNFTTLKKDFETEKVGRSGKQSRKLHHELTVKEAGFHTPLAVPSLVDSLKGHSCLQLPP